MDSISFSIPGRIKGKGRPKFARRGAFVHAYTPADTANSEAMVRSIAAEAMGGRPLFQGPLILDVAMVLNTPASWSKKKKAAAIYVTGKPDIDNIAKLIGDALNGIVWADDSQLCDLHFRRRYLDGRGEYTEISIRAAGEEWITRREVARRPEIEAGLFARKEAAE